MKYNEIEEIINKYAIVGSEKLKEAEKTMTKHTIIEQKKYNIYPTLDKMLYIVKEIRDTNKTPDNYLRLTPFYKNAIEVSEMWNEFDEYMFFIEFRDNVTDNDRKKFIEVECSIEEECSQAVPEKLLFLCERGDADYFNKSLNTYMDYMVKDVLFKIHEAAERYVKDKANLPFGQIGCEIHCD